MLVLTKIFDSVGAVIVPVDAHSLWAFFKTSGKCFLLKLPFKFLKLDSNFEDKALISLLPLAPIKSAATSENAPSIPLSLPLKIIGLINTFSLSIFTKCLDAIFGFIVTDLEYPLLNKLLRISGCFNNL